MIREWANQDRIDEIERALTAPPGWIDPDTGLPAGWTDDEDDEWSMFEAAMRG